MSLNNLIIVLKVAANPVRAEYSQQYFKTGKGQYAEGDVFLGISMPQLRSIIKPFSNLLFEEIQTLLDSKFHEFRMTATLILCEQMKTKDESKQAEIFDFYCQNFKNVNNWDLVDCSCPTIVGKFLMHKDRSILKEWAVSNHLWTQRIAMVSSWYFIRQKDVHTSLEIAGILIHHKHDLIHKAVGWMLREAHKRNPTLIEAFLENQYQTMPRTALRYAIERFSVDKKIYFMAK